MISQSTFPLPKLGPILRTKSADIHDGKGAVVIRGLDPEKYSLRTNIIMFAGLSSYIGDQRGLQSAMYDVLSKSSTITRSWTDESSTNSPAAHMNSLSAKHIPDPRPGLSNEALVRHKTSSTSHHLGLTRLTSVSKPFHNDHCDVLALYVMETASSGGSAYWASGSQVYNEITATQPHLITVLAENSWPHQTSVIYQ